MLPRPAPPKLLLPLLLFCGRAAAHTCIGEPRAHRLRANHPPGTPLPQLAAGEEKDCRGGLCLGQVNGPHWHDWHNDTGNASYPVGTPAAGFTHFSSTMTVPEYPKNKSGICYYIWTDIFFGDVGNGRMNQFVPQLILGNALDGTSGPPDYTPHWGRHETYKFGAHYFFEHVNGSGAAYGKLFDAYVGESDHPGLTLFQFGAGQSRFPDPAEPDQLTLLCCTQICYSDAVYLAGREVTRQGGGHEVNWREGGKA